MPELPDVEHFADLLRHTSLNKRITSVLCRTPTIVKMTTCASLARELHGRAFLDVSRRGKFMIVRLAGSSKKLVVHFGMTGSLDYAGKGEHHRDLKHIHLLIRFGDSGSLVFSDQRKFGRIYLPRDISDVPLLGKLGPEPLDLTIDEFMDVLVTHGIKNVKAMLMEQRIIAGIGNLYSNEILYRARIAPTRRVASLTRTERRKLYRSMRMVLADAIRIAPPEGKFGRAWLLSHMRDGRCPLDRSHMLTKKRIGGRSAYYCPIHQR